MENGIYYSISHRDYHAMTERMSNTYLGRLEECPAAGKVPIEETQAMTFGRALHLYALEGETYFNQNVVVTPKIDMRTKVGQQIKLEMDLLRQNDPDKCFINQDEFEDIKAIAYSISIHPWASQLIGNGVNEISVLWTDKDFCIDCKARPDMLPSKEKRALIDLKKTRSADLYDFQRAIVTYGYYRQAAFYLDGMSEITGEEWDIFALIAVEDKAPYRVEVYTLSKDFITYGRQEYKRLLSIEKQCKSVNIWPNYKYDEVTMIDIPQYLYYRYPGEAV